jgi:hypothetical protein
VVERGRLQLLDAEVVRRQLTTSQFSSFGRNIPVDGSPSSRQLTFALSNPTDRETAAHELVRTYSPPSYADPWECIQDYERVQRYTAEHPKQASQAISTAGYLPRSRIRSWVDSDGRPDCYRGLQTARENGWLVEYWTVTPRGLDQLAAWLFASGSINDAWVPLFVADTEMEIERLRSAAQDAGVSLTSTREDEDRPLEWRPRRDGSVLGRVLHTWIGVRGDKSSKTMQFPRYPQYARRDIARDFIRIYVNLRAVERDDRPDERIQIMEDRSDAYRRDLVALLERVVDSGAVRGDS